MSTIKKVLVKYRAVQKNSAVDLCVVLPMTEGFADILIENGSYNRIYCELLHGILKNLAQLQNCTYHGFLSAEFADLKEAEYQYPVVHIPECNLPPKKKHTAAGWVLLIQIVISIVTTLIILKLKGIL